MKRLPRWHLGTVLAVIAALGVLGRSAPLTSGPTANPCRVTAARDDVPGCVIPGDWDTVLIDLPVGQALVVTGQAILADGTLWWQVDLPHIDRIWVLPGAVQVSGDCDPLPPLDPPLSLERSPCCSSVPSGGTAPNGLNSSNTGGASGGCNE